jgi:nicotinamidase/pyrazinamidase
MVHSSDTFELQKGDALIIVDMQQDFLPGGALAVPHGDAVIPVINRYAAEFSRRGLPVFATRDWHPPDHCSFQEQGGPWPPHCVAETPGAQFPPALKLPKDTIIIHKATSPAPDAYSGFQGTDLEALLRERGCRRVFVCGLATDYCVRATVLDALKADFDAVLLEDAVRPVDVKPGDGERAIQEMKAAGARTASSARILA